MAGIAQSYKEWVDLDLDLGPRVVETWVEDGRLNWVETHVEDLAHRFRVMNRYLDLDLPRRETAVTARQVARNSASWLMRVNFLDAYDWSYTNRSGLMPEPGTAMDKALNAEAVAVDLGVWLSGWRAQLMVDMSYFCTACEKACLERHVDRTEKKRFNKSINAINREMEGVVHAISLNNASPRPRPADAEDEEEED